MFAVVVIVVDVVDGKNIIVTTTPTVGVVVFSTTNSIAGLGSCAARNR